MDDKQKRKIKFNRRKFLKSVGATTIGTILGFPSILKYARGERMFSRPVFKRFFLLLAELVLSFLVVCAFLTECIAQQPSIQQLKDKLIMANKILDAEGLAKPLGHISVRIPNTETFLITRNVAPGMSVLDDILVCNIDGKVIEGKYSRTFSEVVIHSEIYKKRKDIQSVAHTHSLHVIALSMTETPILPASFEAIELGPGPIAIYKKIAFIDKPEQASEICDLLGPNKAVMLKGHGAVIVGKSIEETTILSYKLELAARLQLLAASIGKIAPFTEDEKKPINEFLEAVEKRGVTSTSYGRAWLYYQHVLK